MNKIHVLQTNNPSRLWTNNLRRRLELDEFPEQHPTNIAKHISITSDKEIKEGDWWFDGTNVRSDFPSSFIMGIDKKIILTTDQDLIADGVQAIDDEFLEWFVKNPSCEYVEVSEDYFKPSNMVYGHDTEPYKIIIPKEEFKQGGQDA